MVRTEWVSTWKKHFFPNCWAKSCDFHCQHWQEVINQFLKTLIVFCLLLKIWDNYSLIVFSYKNIIFLDKTWYTLSLHVGLKRHKSSVYCPPLIYSQSIIRYFNLFVSSYSCRYKMMPHYCYLSLFSSLFFNCNLNKAFKHILHSHYLSFSDHYFSDICSCQGDFT